MERRMEKEFTDSSTQTGTKVTGSTARDMARESSPPPTENPIKGNLRMMR